MAKQDMVHNIYKFLRENVTEAQIEAAATYKPENKIIIETINVGDEVIDNKDGIGVVEQIINGVASVKWEDGSIHMVEVINLQKYGIPEKKKEPKDTEEESVKKHSNKSEEDRINKEAAAKESKKVIKEDNNSAKEIVVGEFSDEQVAKEMANEKHGEVVQDPETKKWKVIIKESNTQMSDEEESVVKDIELAKKSGDNKKLGELTAKLDALKAKKTSKEETKESIDATIKVGKEEIKITATDSDVKAVVKDETGKETTIKIPKEPINAPEEPVVEEPIDSVEPKEEVNIEPKKEEEIVTEAKKEEADPNKPAYNLLKRIHKAKDNETLEKLLDQLEKDTISGKIEAEKEVLLRSAIDRKRKELETNPVEPKSEDIAAEEKEEKDLEECVVKNKKTMPVNEFLKKVEEKKLKENIELDDLEGNSYIATDGYVFYFDNYHIEVSKNGKIVTELHYENLTLEEAKKKANESSDDITVGYCESLQKSLKDVLGAEVKLEKVMSKAKTLDRVGLESLKKAMEMRDAEMLKHFLNTLLESK